MTLSILVHGLLILGLPVSGWAWHGPHPSAEELGRSYICSLHLVFLEQRTCLLMKARSLATFASEESLGWHRSHAVAGTRAQSAGLVLLQQRPEFTVPWFHLLPRLRRLAQGECIFFSGALNISFEQTIASQAFFKIGDPRTV